MSAPNSANVPQPDQQPDHGPWTESVHTVYICEEAWGDTTVRPRPPEVPRDYPRPRPPKKAPPDTSR
jgi:hypothetical protein